MAIIHSPCCCSFLLGEEGRVAGTLNTDLKEPYSMQYNLLGFSYRRCMFRSLWRECYMSKCKWHSDLCLCQWVRGQWHKLYRWEQARTSLWMFILLVIFFYCNIYHFVSVWWLIVHAKYFQKPRYNNRWEILLSKVGWIWSSGWT